MTSERILIQLKKKEQYEDLTLYTLEKEIVSFIETGMLHNNDNNSIFISKPLNTPTKEQIIVNNKGSKENSNVSETMKSSPANDSFQSNEDTSTFLNTIKTL